GSNPAMDELLGRLRSLAEEIAVETGSALTIDDSARTPAMNVNRILARRVKTFTGSSDLYQDPVVKSGPTDPTDWAHVSLVTSTTSARFPVSRDLDIVRGTPEFAEASSTGFAFEQMLTIARCIAYTGLDLLGDMEFRGFAEGELLRSVKAQGIERTP